jgi:hypothetical protein
MDKDIQLREFLTAWRDQPFRWGYWDCVLMAGRWADLRMNLAEVGNWIGRYDSELSAKKLIVEEFSGFENIFDRWLRRQPHQLCGTGDIVLGVPKDLKPTYGIIDGDKVIFPGENGITVHGRNSVVLDSGWRVE